MPTNPSINKWAIILAAWVASCVGCYIGGHNQATEKCAAKQDHKKVQESKVVIDTTAKVLEQEHKDDNLSKKVSKDAQDSNTRYQYAMRSLSAANDGLRQQLDQLRADAVPQAQDRAALLETVSTLAGNLSECSAKYSAVVPVAEQYRDTLIQWNELFPDQ